MLLACQMGRRYTKSRSTACCRARRNAVVRCSRDWYSYIPGTVSGFVVLEMVRETEKVTDYNLRNLGREHVVKDMVDGKGAQIARLMVGPHA